VLKIIINKGNSTKLRSPISKVFLHMASYSFANEKKNIEGAHDSLVYVKAQTDNNNNSKITICFNYRKTPVREKGKVTSKRI